MNTKTHIVTDHLGGIIRIDGKPRICHLVEDKKHGVKVWQCRLSHADVKALGKPPAFGRNYVLVNGQYIKEMGRDFFWPIPALPELETGRNLPPAETWIDPLPVPPPVPRNYAGRRARGISPHWQALLDAARLVAPVLPPEHPLRLAIDRCDAARRGERADAEIAAARAAMGAPAEPAVD